MALESVEEILAENPWNHPEAAWRLMRFATPGRLLWEATFPTEPWRVRPWPCQPRVGFDVAVYISGTTLQFRRDGSFEGRNFESNWDGIWSAKAQITSEGWFAEIAIPFKTLPFKPGGETWGVNFARVIKRRGETVRWADPSVERRLTDMAEAGFLENARAETIRARRFDDLVSFVA